MNPIDRESEIKEIAVRRSKNLDKSDGVEVVTIAGERFCGILLCKPAGIVR